jgi:hypothetical protein
MFAARSELDKRAWLVAIKRLLAERQGTSRSELVAAATDAETVEQALVCSVAVLRLQFIHSSFFFLFFFSFLFFWQHTWLKDAPEDIEMFVVQRSFAQAVELGLKATKALAELPVTSVTIPLVESMKARMLGLSATLTMEVQRPALRRNALRAITTLLLKLGNEDTVCFVGGFGVFFDPFVV